MHKSLTNKQLQDTLGNCNAHRTKLEQEVQRLKAKVDLILQVCVKRRTIALDMAAHVAEDFSFLPAAKLKQKILDLIKIDQKQHDTLVARYHMKERHGE